MPSDQMAILLLCFAGGFGLGLLVGQFQSFNNYRRNLEIFAETDDSIRSFLTKGRL